ncbi:MAG: hypothetical protein A4S09_00690 [Proteobacteria bacterium SG_bin7]|nr:MAG: hypothetical protein A4S09_00690 [Proteobacteria bacterium SG_bin7]
MERRTLFIISFCFLSLGVSIELLKNLGRTSRAIKLEASRTDRELGDYDVKLGAENIAANQANVTGFSGIRPIKGIPLANPTPTTESGKKEAEKKKPKIAQNDKKKEDDKKKKKRKKKKKKTDTQSEEGQIAKTKTETKDKRGFGGGKDSYFVTVPADPNSVPKADPIDWERIMLNDPTAADLQKFIEAHRTRNVTDAQYFEIVKQMITGSRANLREYGLNLLSVYPSSSTFVILAEAFFREPASSDYRAKLEKEILVYTKVEFFSLLAGALDRNNSDAVHAMAMETIERAIANYRPLLSQINTSSNSSTAASGDNSGPAPASVPNSNTTGAVRAQQQRQVINGFKVFQNPLRALAAEKDPNTSRRAADLLAAVNSIIALAPPPNPNPHNTQGVVPPTPTK